NAERQGGKRLPEWCGADPIGSEPALVGGYDSFVERRQGGGDAVVVAVSVQGDLRPTQMFEVIAVDRPQEILQCGGNSRFSAVALQGEHHHCSWPRNRLGGAAQDAAIAIVDT